MIAGAGYGKSTLIRHWSNGRRVAWVALRDDPPRSGELSAVIVDALARTGIHVLSGVGGARLADSALDGGQAETQAGIIANAIEGSQVEELVLVVDDLHVLPAEQLGVLPALIRQAPASLHVVLLSRAAPSFPIQRLRANGEVVEIGVDDLAMDVDEIGVLVESSLGVRDESLSMRLLGGTGGWPALIRLIVESVRSLPADRRLAAVDQSMRSGEAVFGYFAEEVFAAEPPEVRDLVRTIAPLDAFDARLCVELGFANAPSILDDLRLRGLFLTSAPYSPDRLILHSLIREYALQRMPLTPDSSVRTREAAARWHARTGEPERAIRIAIDLPERGVVIELLRQHGDELVRHGRVTAVAAAGRHLPAGELDNELALLLGDAEMHLGNWREALADYTRVSAEGESPPAAVGWRMGRLHFERSEFRKAAEVLGRASLDDATDHDRARLLAWRAMSAWHAGELGAYELATEAAEIAERSGDLGAVSLAHTAACYATLTANDDRPIKHFAAAIRAADEAGDLVQRVRLRTAGTGYASLEEHAHALSEVIPAIEAAGNLRWLLRSLHARALCMIDLGRYDEADTDLRRSFEIGQRLGQGDVTPSLVLGDLRRIVGDLAEATEHYQLVLASKTDDRHMTALAKAGLARVLSRTEPDLATTLVSEAIADILPHERVTAEISAGWVALAAGRREEAHQHGEAAIQLATGGLSGDPRSALGHALELGAMASGSPTIRRTRLEEAHAFWLRVGNRVDAATTSLGLAHMDRGPEARAAQARALAVIRSAGVRASAADAAGFLAELPRERPPAIVVRTFGAFQLLRGGVPVPVGEWRSKKPRDLLKILIARRGAVARDELIETLWPDEDANATADRLSVGLSLLRSVLDPRREHPADAFVTTERGALRLVVDDIAIDFDDFMRGAGEGLELRRRGQDEAALDELLAAEALYAGDMFEEDAYADWAVGPREEARATYIQVARAIADLLRETGDEDGAARYLMRILARDPFDEAAHLALVSSFNRGRHHGEARRAYQAYVGRMSEIDVEPAPYPATA